MIFKRPKRKDFQKILSWQNKILIIKISVPGKLFFPNSSKNLIVVSSKSLIVVRVANPIK